MESIALPHSQFYFPSEQSLNPLSFHRVPLSGERAREEAREEREKREKERRELEGGGGDETHREAEEERFMDG